MKYTDALCKVTMTTLCYTCSKEITHLTRCENCLTPTATLSGSNYLLSLLNTTKYPDYDTGIEFMIKDIEWRVSLLHAHSKRYNDSRIKDLLQHEEKRFYNFEKVRKMNFTG
jgi:hypothetical protein